MDRVRAGMQAWVTLHPTAFCSLMRIRFLGCSRQTGRREQTECSDLHQGQR